MTDHEQRWAEVGAHVREAMDWKGMTQGDLCAATGLSRETVRPIMQGKPNSRRRTTLAKIARAIGWTPDSIDRILAGEPPVVVDLRPGRIEADGVDLGRARIIGRDAERNRVTIALEVDADRLDEVAELLEASEVQFVERREADREEPDLDDYAFAAERGATHLDDVDDDRGESHRPRPPAPSGDEGA